MRSNLFKNKVTYNIYIYIYIYIYKEDLVLNNYQITSPNNLTSDIISIFFNHTVNINIYIYIYIYISSSSSYRAGSTDIRDPLSPLLPIVHRPR